MSGLEPSGPAQPRLQDAYETPSNPADQTPREQDSAQQNRRAQQSDGVQAVRVPREQSTSIADATPTSLGYGIHGAPPGEETRGKTQQEVGRAQELEAEQMAAPGEGKVAKAVNDKPGASGSMPGMESDLDRKKAEQAPLREKVDEARREEVDVGAVLGQTGGPANPVDKGGYPNGGAA